MANGRPRRKHLVTGIAAAAGLAGLGVLGAACPAPDERVESKSAIDHGEALFNDPKISGTAYNEMSCATCHEAHFGDSDGRLPGAPMVGVIDRPSYWGGSEDTLLGSVNACLYYYMLANDPWTGDEENAKAIYAYLEHLSETAVDSEKAAQPFTVVHEIDPLPAGDKSRGEGLYVAACASCHGSKSTGKDRLVERAPVLPDETLKAHPDPTYSASDRRLVFIEKTRHGGFLGYGGQMPPLSAEVLSDEDVADILTYLGVPIP